MGWVLDASSKGRDFRLPEHPRSPHYLHSPRELCGPPYLHYLWSPQEAKRRGNRVLPSCGNQSLVPQRGRRRTRRSPRKKSIEQSFEHLRKPASGALSRAFQQSALPSYSSTVPHAPDGPGSRQRGDVSTSRQSAGRGLHGLDVEVHVCTVNSAATKSVFVTSPAWYGRKGAFK
jgi:hypothetical protein